MVLQALKDELMWCNMDINRRYTGVLYILLLMLIPCLGIAGDQTDFPVPKQLEPNVEFWVHVFTLYSENQVVIHDSYYPQIVYEIVNLDDYYAPQTPLRIKWKLINRTVEEYQSILRKFSTMKTIDITTLTDKERHVYLEWVECKDPDKFKRASYAVRGQRGLKEDFKAGLERSGKYIPEFQEIFRRNNIPVELVYLPHIESSFQNRAYSKVGATGLWQFIRSTGRLYLHINRYEDERLDPFAASEAAARLLKNNYQILGTWPLAITAYNHGTNGMLRAKHSLRTDDFGVIVEKYNSRSFGFASRNFYAEFLAAIRVRENYKNYFESVNFEKPDNYVIFSLPESASLNTICENLDVPKSHIVKMNPQLLSRVITSQVDLPRDFELRIPLRQNIDPYLLYAGAYERNSHRLEDWVPENDFQSFIDDLYSTSLATTNVRLLQEELTNSHEYVSLLSKYPVNDPELYVFASSDLKTERIEPAAIPVVSIPEPETEIVELAGTAKTPEIEPVVALADTTSVDSLLLVLNQTPYGPDAPDTLVVNPVDQQVTELMQKMDFTIRRSKWITVLPNETLGHYAEWLNVSTQALRSLNNLGYRRSIHIGQTLKITLSQTNLESFKEKRMQYHLNLRQAFYSDYSIIGTQAYTIKNGDNIWYLCKRKFNVPFWLVANYNLGILLNSIKPGDVIHIPIISPFVQNKSKEYQG